MRRLVVVLVVLLMALAGCTKPHKYDPAPDAQYDENLSLRFSEEYDGAAFNDDEDLVAYFEDPSGKFNTGKYVYQENLDDVYAGSAIHLSCYKYWDEYKGEPWWLEITLYTEADKEVVVNKQRFTDIDCLRYWIHIDNTGQMEMHLGYHPDDRVPVVIPTTLSIILFFGGTAVALGGMGFLGVWYYRKRKE